MFVPLFICFPHTLLLCTTCIHNLVVLLPRLTGHCAKLEMNKKREQKTKQTLCTGDERHMCVCLLSRDQWVLLALLWGLGRGTQLRKTDSAFILFFFLSPRKLLASRSVRVGGKKPITLHIRTGSLPALCAAPRTLALFFALTQILSMYSALNTLKQILSAGFLVRWRKRKKNKQM